MNYLFFIIVIAVVIAVLWIASFTNFELDDAHYDRLKWVVLKWGYIVAFIGVIVKAFNMPYGVETVTIVGAIGVSTHHVDITEMMADIPECDIVFPLINYAGLGIRKGAGPGTAEEMEAAIRKCLDAGKGVFAMKAFGGGNLTGTYMKSLNYVRDLGCHSIMIGMGNKGEIDDIVRYAEGELPEDYQPETRNKKIHIDQGDCESCYACIERCPNKAIYVNDEGRADVNYDVCLTCGYCAPVCPVRAIIMW